MSDPTESIRRELVIEINTDPGSRAALRGAHGKVWDTQQLAEDFEVLGFSAPFVVVRRKLDDVRGSLILSTQPTLLL